MIRTRTTVAGSTAFLALGIAINLAGCAIEPTEVESERLDSNTGTTVTLMPKPVELIVEKPRGTKTDPFAYVAPFETNRMGSHELYLWVSAPQAAGALSVPQLYCGNNLVPLDKFEGTPKEMGLSNAPYKTPAPWSAQWYFKVSGEVLDCLATAPRIRITTQAADATEPDSYVAEGQAASAVNVFLSRVRT
ncbi:MAG: hypothetical protein WDO68_13025 [Gammaproteobacteria bacterium]